FENFSVIIIDDDALCADGIASLLGSWGCKITVFRSLPTALPQSDFLIIDQSFGSDTSGIDWLEELHRQGHRPRAALLTASLEEQLTIRCRSLSVPILRKPVQPGQLRSLLITATRQQSDTASNRSLL
ncbi:response regulator, partial [Thalassospira xiamenensis]|uniref:response regulator n=1 Tax=Thalassospira xiamenensis TaxID=220697 RepID=UPI00115CE024